MNFRPPRLWFPQRIAGQRAGKGAGDKGSDPKVPKGLTPCPLPPFPPSVPQFVEETTDVEGESSFDLKELVTDLYSIQLQSFINSTGVLELPPSDTPTL